ncbi:MAG: hypothetical protein ACLQVD_21025 [Capsulimonadaceae bacterium]
MTTQFGTLNQGTRNLVSACVMAGALFLSLTPGPTRADILVDKITDFTHIESHTDNWKFASDNPQRFEGRTSRLQRTDGNEASIVYHFKGISNYDVYYTYWAYPSPAIKIDISADGTTWYPNTWWDFNNHGISGIYDWRSEDLKPQNPLPGWVNYVRITIPAGVFKVVASGPSFWSPQIDQVTIAWSGDLVTVQGATKPNAEITSPGTPGTPGAPGAPGSSTTPTTPAAAPVEAPALSIPGGLTAMAASDTASIQWVPIQSASTYTVKRSDDLGVTYTPLASNVSSNYYVDKGLKNQNYCYRLVGLKGDGSAVATESVSVKPIKGAVMMTDPFDDWSQADSHTDNMELAKYDGIANCAKRSTTDFGSVVYNLAGSVRLAFTTFFSGDITGQLSVEASSDGQEWTPIKMAYTQPEPFGNPNSGHFSSVWAPTSDLPAGTNYLRINLLGDPNQKTVADTPAIADVRIAYGTFATPTPTPLDAEAPRTLDTFEDPLTDWSKTSQHSDCLQLDGKCDNRTCIQRHGPTAGTVEYHVPKATSFSLEVYYDSAQDEYSVESSTDGQVWAPVELNTSDPVPASGDRRIHVSVTQKQPLPDGTAYLRITFSGTWGVEVGGIKIFSPSTSVEAPAVALGTPGDGGLPVAMTVAANAAPASQPSNALASDSNSSSNTDPSTSTSGSTTPATSGSTQVSAGAASASADTTPMDASTKSTDSPPKATVGAQ